MTNRALFQTQTFLLLIKRNKDRFGQTFVLESTTSPEKALATTTSPEKQLLEIDSSRSTSKTTHVDGGAATAVGVTTQRVFTQRPASARSITAEKLQCQEVPVNNMDDHRVELQEEESKITGHVHTDAADQVEDVTARNSNPLPQFEAEHNTAAPESKTIAEEGPLENEDDTPEIDTGAAAQEPRLEDLRAENNAAVPPCFSPTFLFEGERSKECDGSELVQAEQLSPLEDESEFDQRSREVDVNAPQGRGDVLPGNKASPGEPLPGEGNGSRSTEKGAAASSSFFTQLFYRNKNAGGSVATSSSSSSSATAARAAVVGLTANNTGVISPVICGASSFCVANEDRAADVTAALQEESRGGIVLDHLAVDVVPDNDKEDNHAVKNEPHHYNHEEITINDPGLRAASFLDKSSTVEINSKPQLLVLPGGAELQQTKENNKIATKLLRAGPQQASAALGRMFLRRKYEKLHQDGRNDGCSSVVQLADDGANRPDVLVTEPASENPNTKAVTTTTSSSSKKQRVVPDLRLPKPRKVFLEDVDPEFAATPASSSRSLSKARLGSKFSDFKNLISEKTLNVRSTTLVVNKAKELAARINVGRSREGGQHLLLNSRKKDAEEQARREHDGGRKNPYAILEHPRMTEVRQQDYSALSGEDLANRELHDVSTKLQYRYNGISAVCSGGNGLEIKHSTHCHFDRGSSSAMPPDMKKQAPLQETNLPRPTSGKINTEEPEAEKNFTLSQASRTQEFWVFVTTNGVSGGCLACILIHLDSILFPFRGELLTYFYATMSVNAGLSAVFVSIVSNAKMSGSGRMQGLSCTFCMTPDVCDACPSITDLVRAF